MYENAVKKCFPDTGKHFLFICGMEIPKWGVRLSRNRQRQMISMDEACALRRRNKVQIRGCWIASGDVYLAPAGRKDGT